MLIKSIYNVQTSILCKVIVIICDIYLIVKSTRSTDYKYINMNISAIWSHVMFAKVVPLLQSGEKMCDQYLYYHNSKQFWRNYI